MEQSYRVRVRILPTLLLAPACLLALSAAAAAQTPVQTKDPQFVAEAAAAAAAQAPRPAKAKNLIVFLGDGMGVSTVTAARIYAGQQAGKDGPSARLAFEALPHTALARTYARDAMVTDSAASITAILTGVKAPFRTLGLGEGGKLEDCASSKAARVESVGELARRAGKAVGVVTNTRITHATPAGLYAHSADREWESDDTMTGEAVAAGCIDIARQLVAFRPEVALGGGRARFLPSSAEGGRREDGRDLLADWRKAGGVTAVSADELKAAARDKPVLGLFAAEHLPYEADRATLGEGVPTLAEMTTAALDRLAGDPDGYVLLVEGGKIDMASHINNAYRTVTETVAFSDAVAAALAKVNLDDTLVIVTADHSHGLVLNGYQPRSAPVLGLAGDEGRRGAADGKAYTTLTFATGPGAPEGALQRADPDAEDAADPDYRQQAGVLLGSAAHSGEDVGVWAGGPGAELVRGSVENTYLFQVMRRALGFDAAPVR